MPVEFFSYEILFVASTLALQLLSALHALLRKREPRSALGWLAICIGLPIIGALIYFVFGINRVQTRAQKLRDRTVAQRRRDGIDEDSFYVWGREPWRNRFTEGNSSGDPQIAASASPPTANSSTQVNPASRIWRPRRFGFASAIFQRPSL